MADMKPSDDEQTSECNLIVNYLPWTMCQEEVRRLFSRVGTVDSCRLVKDKKTGQSLGYAFVRYRSRAMATRAIQTFNGFRIQNKIIKVSVARPRCSRIRGANVYVSGLDKTVTSADLEELFRPFGTIISCRVLYDERTGLSRGVGFVLFNLRSEADTAIRSLNATVPRGSVQPIRVMFATPPKIGTSRPWLMPLPVALPRTGGIYGQAMHFTGLLAPTRMAASCGMTANVNLTTPAELGVISCRLATPVIEFTPPLKNVRPIDQVNRQVTLVVTTRNENGEAATDGSHQQTLLASEKEEKYENKSLLSPPQSKIIVRNLPSDVEESALWRLFGPFGAVQEIRLQGNHTISTSTSSTSTSSSSTNSTSTSIRHTVQEAIVTMKSARKAAQAVRALDGWTLDEHHIINAELLGEEGEEVTDAQRQRQTCDRRLLGKSFCLGKDFDV